jgi:hypothetical protein
MSDHPKFELKHGKSTGRVTDVTASPRADQTPSPKAARIILKSKEDERGS